MNVGKGRNHRSFDSFTNQQFSFFNVRFVPNLLVDELLENISSSFDQYRLNAFRVELLHHVGEGGVHDEGRCFVIEDILVFV